MIAQQNSITPGGAGRSAFFASLGAAVLTGAFVLVWSASAQAQVRCPEGKTASGECVDPGFGSATRQAAVIFTQPKISQTAFPVLPVDDLTYRYPHQIINDPLSRPSGECVLFRGACR